MGSTKGYSKVPKEYGMGKAVGKANKCPKDIEGEMIDNIDLKNQILQLAETVMPLLKGDAASGDIMKMIDRAGPLAMLELIQLMFTTKNEKIKHQTTKDILDRAGFKPPDKKINIHESVDRMSPEQLDAFLMNSFRGLDASERGTLMKFIEGPDGTFEVEEDYIEHVKKQKPKEA